MYLKPDRIVIARVRVIISKELMENSFEFWCGAICTALPVRKESAGCRAFPVP